ncbi:heme ABC transporter permease [Rhodospirillaceae bacterium KN72]|uniref:Heme exporter protein C n=1 Tax=Pacificispira spongiicola TaxID=2729598 RepID=A0A7Y0HGH7_9PROT|nr:heme ABC transporter permease [Pacificispira spongiicola]NMM44947.1 heme ABC transporter permease [Pacificispira spongiicola]
MHRFANPSRFMRVADALLPWMIALCLPLFAAGLYYGLYQSPADFQQSETVRVMYIHVPTAFLAQAAYVVMALGSASFLIWKHPLGDLIARSAAPVGAVFCFVCLVTGSLWGKPTWGTYWVWDARLTSMLILQFLFFGYLALANAFDDPARGDKPAAILAVVGIVNIPIIKFSVYFFNTLHQQSTLFGDLMGGSGDAAKSVNQPDIAAAAAEQGSALAPEMLLPLMLMFGAFSLFFLILLVLRLRGEWASVRLRALRAGFRPAPEEV